MSCIPKLLADCCLYAFEQTGLYEPLLTVDVARKRLETEREIWNTVQENKGAKDALWGTFQLQSQDEPLPLLVKKGMDRLEENEIQTGVAVDLGCGTGTTVFRLLEKGWKVYAVDNSKSVLQQLAKRVSDLGKDWIENKRLVLVDSSIETFEYPEKVHLITATDSLPYCDPRKLDKIFLNARNALSPKGVFVATLFPYENEIVDNMLRAMFGAWMTTKNVVDAIMRSADFSRYSVTEGNSPGGKCRQFHILAEA